MSFEIVYTLVKDQDTLKRLANEISTLGVNDIVALDLETEGFDPYSGRVRIISLNVREKVYVVDLFLTGTPTALVSALQTYRGVTVGQNLKFDQKWLWHHYRIKFHKPFDTYRASNLVYNGKRDHKNRPLGHNLYDLYWRELEETPIAPDLGAADWGGTLTKEHYDYAAEDVLLLPILRRRFLPKLMNLGLTKVAQIEFNVIYAEARMELTGFPINKEAWLRLAEENLRMERELRIQLMRVLPNPIPQMALYDPEVLEAPLRSVDLDNFEEEESDNYIEWLTRQKPKAKINSRGGQLFNVDSQKQILKSLQEMGLKTLDEKGVMRPIQDTNEMTLCLFSSKVPAVKLLLAQRDMATRIKMFGAGFLKNVNPKTGRIHGSFFPFTGTGRYAMRSPNLQQIPRLTSYRKCFAAPQGRCFAISDFSQVELRIMAQLSKDPVLIDAYKRGLDIHSVTASIVSGIPLEKIDKDGPERQAAKPINFGYIYGLGAATFVLYSRAQYGVEITLDKAKEFRNKYFDTYKGVAKYQAHMLEREKPSGVIRTLSGRIRYLPPEAHNEWLNSADQGTGADVLKIAMARIVDDLDRTRLPAELAHVVHDETILEYDNQPEVAKEVKPLVVSAMNESLAQFITCVPAVTDSKSGLTWADKK